MKRQLFHLGRAQVLGGMKVPPMPDDTVQDVLAKQLPRQFARWASRTVHLVLAVSFFTAFSLAPAAAETPRSIDMKLLVVSADGTEPVFAGIKSILNQVGVPYDTLIASQTPLTAQTLSDGLGAGRYQGVLLAIPLAVGVKGARVHHPRDASFIDLHQRHLGAGLPGRQRDQLGRGEHAKVPAAFLFPRYAIGVRRPEADLAGVGEVDPCRGCVCRMRRSFRR